MFNEDYKTAYIISRLIGVIFVLDKYIYYIYYIIIPFIEDERDM